MKKLLAIFALASLALTASPAFAQAHGLHLEWVKGNLQRHLSADKFVAIGSVASINATTLTLNVESSAHVANVVAGQAIIALNADTKVVGGHDNDNPLSLADVHVADRVVVSGSVSGSVLTAAKIWKLDGIVQPKQKAYGKVTAKTDSSVTIQNSLTGVSQAFTVDGDTKVSINGETKTVSDIAVGDAGWVKFRTNAGVFLAKMIKLFR